MAFLFDNRGGVTPVGVRHLPAGRRVVAQPPLAAALGAQAPPLGHQKSTLLVREVSIFTYYLFTKIQGRFWDTKAPKIDPFQYCIAAD